MVIPESIAQRTGGRNPEKQTQGVINDTYYSLDLACDGGKPYLALKLLVKFFAS